MKKTLFALSLLWCTWSWCAEQGGAPEPVTAAVGASSATPLPPSAEERRLEGQRLDLKGQQIEAQYQQDIKQCYQKFDVVSCRVQARERRINAKAELRKEELPFNAMERKLNAEEAQQRLKERQSEASNKQKETERAEALSRAKQRADANAQKNIDHGLQGTKRGDYEDKQREAAQHRADAEKKQRERNKESAAPLPVPGK